MPSIEYRPDRPKPYRARYWGPDGRLHSRSFTRKDDAERWLTSEEASKLGGAWVDPRGSRRRFDDWATQWWELWASEPRRSPAALEAAESHLRLHIRPYFGRRPLGTISAQVVQRWQNELERRASHNLTMACRSILNRILEAAEAERLIPVNPVRKVRAPKRPVDPEVVFGRVRRRTYTPEEFGRLLVGCPAFYRDHFLVQVGTGLRSGELLGLRARRVDLHRGRIEVVDVRYDAGRFGRGTRIGPRATPASGRCRSAARSLRRWPAGWTAALRTGWCSAAPGAATRCRVAPARSSRWATTGASMTAPLPERGLRRTSTCASPRPAPHLRHVAGGQRRPGAGDRRANGPPRRAASRWRRQRHRAALSAHDDRDAGARARGHRPLLGGGANNAGVAAVTLFVTVSGRSPPILSATVEAEQRRADNPGSGQPAEGRACPPT